MKIAIVAKTRSEPLIRFRRKRGLSQTAAAAEACVSARIWSSIERMDFSAVSMQKITEVALFLGLETTDICPPEVAGMKLGMERVLYKEIATSRLLAAAGAQMRLVAPSPLDVLTSTEVVVREGWDRVKHTLSARQRLVLELRFGLGANAHASTLEEVGEIIGLSRERVRQTEAKAIRLLQHPIRAWVFEQALYEK